MPDDSQPYVNGWSDPADMAAGELATWWDRRVEQRRVANTELTHGEATTTVVERLEVLSRTDELSSPRPGFLDHLESQIMQTSPGMLPVAPSSTRRDPAVLPVPRLGPPRRSRGLIDILSVAAVLALLLGGSWAVWNGKTTAPTPGGLNRVVGVSTPDPNGLEPLVREVTLDQPWAEPVSGSPLNGLVPVPVTDCTTPSRSADWFGSITEPAATPLPLVSGAPSTALAGAVSPAEMAQHPAASGEDRQSVVAFYRQLVACRNALDPGSDQATFMLAGPFWNLLSTDYLLQLAQSMRQDGYTLQGFDLYFQAIAALGIQVFAPIIADVRALPDDALGRRQLLVASKWVAGYPSEQMTVLVMEDGRWRVGASNVMQYPAGPSKRDAGVASLYNGRWFAGMEGSDGRLFSGMPLSITVTNTTYSNVTVSIGGQDVGTVTYGETLYTTPFRVPPEIVQAAGGQFPIDVSIVGLGTLATEPYHLTVDYSDPEVQSPFATPAAPAAQIAGEATPSAVSAGDLVSLDQPWAENLPNDALSSAAAVNAADCTTPSRPAGSVAAAIEKRAALGDAAPTIEPEFIANGRIDPADYPAGSAEDVAASNAFFQQLSACRFQTGDRDGTALLPYTGAYWNLFSNDAFDFQDFLAAGQAADEVVNQQGRFARQFVDAWSYPGAVLDVRQVPNDAAGQRRLLVTAHGVYPTTRNVVSLLVEEDGQWRYLVPSVLPYDRDSEAIAQQLDIVVGEDRYGPRATANFVGRLEAVVPVAMTVANRGVTPQRVTVDGQDVGVVQPGASVVVQPFQVRPGAVTDAGGRFTFSIESTDLGGAADVSAARPLAVAVYPPGSLEPNGQFADAATPPIEGTPGAQRP